MCFDKIKKIVGTMVLGTSILISLVAEAEWTGVAVKRTTAYLNSGLTQRNGVEYVDKGDTITVLREEGNAYYVRYPLARGGTKERWVSKDIFGNVSKSNVTSNTTQANYQAWSAVMKQRATAYLDANLTQRNGVEYADKGDTVTVLNESSKSYYIRYPLSRGGTKDRWVNKNTVSNSNNASSTDSRLDKLNQANSVIQNNIAQAQNITRPFQQWKGVATQRATAYHNSGLTVRQGVEYVGKGDTVTVLQEEGNAYFVRYPLSRGGTKDRWVNKKYIQRQDTANTSNTNVNALASSAINAVENAVQNAYQQWQGIANNRAIAYHNSGLTVRKGVEYVSKGDTVTVLQEEGNAYFVRYPLSRGGTKDRWVNKKYIQRQESANTGATGALVNGANNAINTVIQNSYQQWQGIANNRAIAYHNSGLTVRKGVEYVGKGDTVTVLQEEGNAYFVRYPLSRGGTKDRWVNKKYIQRQDAVSAGGTSAFVNGVNNAVGIMQNNSVVWPVGGNGGYDNNNWINYNDPNNTDYHSGTDITADAGLPVYATHSGIVDTVKSLTTSYGKHIIIKCNVNNKIVYIYYCHLSSFADGIKENVFVNAGQIIGAVGSTGKSTGPHLHYEVRNSNKHYGNKNNPTLNPHDYLPKR